MTFPFSLLVLPGLFCFLLIASPLKAQNPGCWLSPDKDAKVALHEKPATPVVADVSSLQPPVFFEQEPRGEWIVLPESIGAYQAPRLDAPQTGPALAWPQTVSGVSWEWSQEKEGRLAWLGFSQEGETYYLPAAWLTRKTPHLGGNLPLGREKVDKLHALPLDYKPDDLKAVPGKWTYHKDAYRPLRQPALTALLAMLEAAKKEGCHLRVVSAYRSAALQRTNYLARIARSNLFQRAVAKPGHSEHQLGTTVDLNGLDPKTLLEASFGETAEGKWLEKNGEKFGFYRSYTEANEFQTGYIPEAWHYRYWGKERP